MRTLRLVPALLVAIAFGVHAQSPADVQLGVRLDSAMRAAEAGGFSGVVRVDRGGVTLLEKGYGMADRAERIPFTPATVVQIGSNTKDFTAVAILKLQAEGRLSLDDRLAKYWPSAPADKRDITIRQLLDHRAGFPLGLGGDFDPVSRDALVDSAMKFRLLFPPGTRESYSNTGYSLLAAIIERVTGRSYDQYVAESMLAPLGLRRTGFLLPGFAMRDLAHGYLASGRDAGTMLAKPHAADGPWWNLRGNGGMLSTAGDMHAFYAALFGGETVLTRAARGTRFDPSQPMGLAGSDGVNFFLYDRFPPLETEIIIASTNAAVRAPAIRATLGALLGLPSVEGPGEAVARREGGTPAPAPIAAVLNELVQVINAADTAATRRFITAHFTSDAGGPTLAERLERFGMLHERLGALVVERIESFPDGPVEVALRSAIEGRAMLRVQVEREAPYRIRGMQVMVGG